MHLRLLLSFSNDCVSHRNHRKKGRARKWLHFASFIHLDCFSKPNRHYIGKKTVKYMTFILNLPRLVIIVKLNKIKEWKRFFKCKCGRSCSSRRGGATGNPVGTPFASFYPNNWSRERKEKTEKERKEKNEFLWLFYDAMKACWTHQNRQQWSRLSKKMKCLHSWAGEGKEARRRAAPEVVLWQGVNPSRFHAHPKLQTTRPTSAVSSTSLNLTCAQRIALQ